LKNTGGKEFSLLELLVGIITLPAHPDDFCCSFWPLESSPTIQTMAKLRFDLSVYAMAHPRKQINANDRRFEQKSSKTTKYILI
jgi:hypothetical protein